VEYLQRKVHGERTERLLIKNAYAHVRPRLSEIVKPPDLQKWLSHCRNVMNTATAMDFPVLLIE